MPTYGQPTQNMKNAFEDVRNFDAHRERLAEVEIAMLAAYASKDKDGEPRGEALARDGDPILGKVRIMTLEDRADGTHDVRLILNGDLWGQLSVGSQRAVVDMCLMRIEVVIKDGRPKRDDAGRPVLRKRKWDYNHCGFVEVDERHGLSSPAVQELRTFFNEHGQTYMSWIDEAPPADFVPIASRRRKRKPKELGEGGADASGNYTRGPLGSKLVRERLQHVESRATVLGVLQLELEHAKPRDPVVKALKDRLIGDLALPDYIAVEKGDEPSVKPDLAAAVLLTSKAKPSLDLLDRVVPECCDAKVLAWILDDEGDEDPREEVLEVVNSRIRELSA